MRKRDDGLRIDCTPEVTWYDLNSKVELKIDAGPPQLEESMTFEPIEGGTRLTIVYEGEPGGFFKVAERIVTRCRDRQGAIRPT